MAATDFKFHDSARQPIDGSVNELANAAKVMVGPKGRNVVLEHSFGAPAMRDKNISPIRDSLPIHEAASGTGKPLRIVAEEGEGEALAPPVVNSMCVKVKANAGDEPSGAVSKARANNGSFGWNATTGVFGDLLKMGVADSTTGTSAALQNVASNVALILAAEAMKAELPREEKKPARSVPELDS